MTLDQVIQQGIRADQPAATAVPPGTLYSVTDEAYVLERSDGAVWVQYAPAGGGDVTHTGTLTSGTFLVGNGGADLAPVSTERLPIANQIALPDVITGRLTTQSGVPVSTADRTAQGTIYYTPALGGNAITNGTIALYTGAVVAYVAFTELSLVLSGLTSGKNYDVFVDYNSGTPQLVLSAAWTDDTTRADALGVQSGLIIKSGTAAYRWVGTIRTTGTTTTEDSAAKRFVWNAYQQVARPLSVVDTTDSWTYTTATLRQANNAGGNQLDYVVGDASVLLRAEVYVASLTSAAASYQVNIGVDSTSVGSAQVSGTNGAANQYSTHGARYSGSPGLGRHVLVWLEQGGGTGSTTWYGDHGGGVGQSGIVGVVLG